LKTVLHLSNRIKKLFTLFEKSFAFIKSSCIFV
jgi:hypothetical protein